MSRMKDDTYAIVHTPNMRYIGKVVEFNQNDGVGAIKFVDGFTIVASMSNIFLMNEHPDSDIANEFEHYEEATNG